MPHRSGMRSSASRPRSTGSRRAAAAPVHAYLFVGPAGSTKTRGGTRLRRPAAAAVRRPERARRRPGVARRASRRPRGRRESAPSITFDQAREIVRAASLAPVEGDRKVMILDEFHLLRPEGAAILLKTIEEPPPSTIFLDPRRLRPARSDHDLVALRPDRVRARSASRRSSSSAARRRRRCRGRPREAAAAAGGNIERARVLACDPELADAPRGVRRRCRDGSTAPAPTVMRIVDDLLALIESAAAPLARAPRRPRSPSSTNESPATASVGAARRRSRSATSASSAGTAPTSCSPGSR